MTGYLIFWAISLAGLAGFVGYWVRRFDRGHRERMAAIEAAAAADQARLEARRSADAIFQQRARDLLRELAILSGTEVDHQPARQDATGDEMFPEPPPDRPLLPGLKEIEKLPRWVRVAFAARCARRVLPLFKHSWPDAPEHHVGTVENDVEVAELSASTARAAARAADIDTVVAALGAHTVAAPAARATARAAFRAAVAAEVADSPYNIDAAAEPYEAAAAAAEADPGIVPYIRRDFDRLARLAEQERWTDDTPVPRSVFGPMWDGDPPPWWADDVATDAESRSTEEQEPTTTPSGFTNGHGSRPPATTGERPGS